MVACLVAMLLAGPVMAGTGWFAGATVGQTEFGDYELEAESSSLDDSDTGFGVYGGWQLNEYVAFGAGFVDLGELNASGDELGEFGGFTDKLEASGFEIFTTGMLPVSDSVSLSASLGAFNWDQDVTFVSEFEDFRGSASGTDLVYGAGVNWDILQENGLHVHLFWKTYKKVGDLEKTGHENDISYLAAAVSYLFGK